MLHTILKILFPSPCLSCGYLSEPLCERCFGKLRFSPHVRVLDERVDRKTGEISGGMRVCSGLYYQPDSILGKLIHPFKYKHHAEIFRVFVPHMIEALQLLVGTQGLSEEVILVPVPLHRRRELERGYNQAELLARWVARQLGCRFGNVLERVKDTGSQAQVERRAERRKNMEGAFRLKTRFSENRAGAGHLKLLKDSQIVLVDDIVTSGATLLACRDSLVAADVQNISALTLADREKTLQNPWD